MPRTPTTPETFGELQIAAKSGRHSSVRAWLLRYYDEFHNVVSRPGRTNWQAVADELNRQGVVNNNSWPLTGESVRQAWLWVRKRKAIEVLEASGAVEPIVDRSERDSASVRDFLPSLRTEGFKFQTLNKKGDSA